jgi:hypothetical protein
MFIEYDRVQRDSETLLAHGRTLRINSVGKFYIILSRCTKSYNCAFPTAFERNT